MALTLLGNYARGTLDGPCSPAEAGRQIAAALAAARAQQVSRLLIDLRPLVLAETPGVGERYALGGEIASAGNGLRQVAVLLEGEALAVFGFAFLVASNLGLPTAGFADESCAVAWLLDGPRRGPAGFEVP